MRGLWLWMLGCAVMLGAARAVNADTLSLKDGTVLHGELIRETPEFVEFLVKQGTLSSLMRYKRNEVASIERFLEPQRADHAKPPAPVRPVADQGPDDPGVDQPVLPDVAQNRDMNTPPVERTLLSDGLTELLPSLLDPFRINFTNRPRRPNAARLEAAAEGEDEAARHAASVMLGVLRREDQIARSRDIQPEAEMLGLQVLLGFFLAFLEGRDDGFGVARDITNGVIQPGQPVYQAAAKMRDAALLEIENVRDRVRLKRWLLERVNQSAADVPQLDGVTLRFSFGLSSGERIGDSSRTSISVRNETGKPLNDVFLFVRVVPDLEVINRRRLEAVAAFLAAHGIENLMGIEGKDYWELRVDIVAADFELMELGDFRAVHVPRLLPDQRLSVDAGVVANVRETVKTYEVRLVCAEGQYDFQPLSAEDMRAQVERVQRAQGTIRTPARR